MLIVWVGYAVRKHPIANLLDIFLYRKTLDRMHTHCDNIFSYCVRRVTYSLCNG